jgi:hypothetical protein
VTRCLTSRRSQPPLTLSGPLSRFTSRVGGGSAFFVRPLRTMKTSYYKNIGIVLLAGVLAAAIVFQFFGSGLISSDTSPPHITTIAPHITETSVSIMRVHTRRILALLAVAGIGLLFVIRSKHYERPAA